MKKMTKIGLAFGAAVALVTGLTISSLAWGPVSNRKTFTMEKPATYVTFNSITNNNTEGDERYFVTAQAEPIKGGQWRDTTVVENGKYYTVKMYVHNNAASNYKLVAHNVTANTTLKKQNDGTWKATGMITSSNANPKSVWDETTFKTANGEDFTLSFISGSAKYTNADKNDKVRTFNLSNDILGSKGVLLGYNKMDGNIPGCLEYSGVITYRVKATVTPKKKTCEDYGYKSNPEGNYTVKKEVKTDDGQTLICYIPKKKTCEDYGYKSNPEGNYTVKKEVKTDDGQTLICYIEEQKTCEDYGYKSNPEGNFTEKKEVTINGETVICYAEKVVVPPTEEAPTQPVVNNPTSLPKSGPTEVISSVVGLSSLAMATAYYVSSRKRLQ